MGAAFGETIGVASLNILLDKTKSNLPRDHKRYVEPQHERIDALSGTLRSLPIPLDVVMLQEVQIEGAEDNARRLADNLELENVWRFRHNSRRRKGEHLVVLGNKVEHAYAIRVGDDRKAIITIIGGIAFAGVHNRSGVVGRRGLFRKTPGEVRVENTRRTIAELNHYDRAVYVGDTNARPGSKARNLLLDAGYSSVFTMIDDNGVAGNYPITFPTDNYREITMPPWVPLEHLESSTILPHAMSLDTIDVRGFRPDQILRAGTVMTEKSDHKTLYAELAY